MSSGFRRPGNPPPIPRMSPRTFLPIVFAALVAPAFAAPLDPLFAPEDFWETKPDALMATAGRLGYQWTSNLRDSARVARLNMTMFGLPVAESVVRFEGEKLKDVVFSLYARGIEPDWPEDKFRAFVARSMDAVTEVAKVKYSVRGKDPTNAVKADGVIWKNDRVQILLEYSVTKEVKARGIPFRPEFVRLEIAPPAKTTGRLGAAPVPTPGTAKFSGAAHVKRNEETGDVWLDGIPMVNQGQNGFSILANTERVMRYYGIGVDAHELAQAANVSWQRSLSTAVMVETLKKLGSRMKFRVREVEPWNSADFARLITEYNRVAKRESSATIPDDRRGMDVTEVYRLMKPDLLKEVRTKNKSDLNRFQRQIRSGIDEGTPMLWMMILGVVPEPEPGIAGGTSGHARLIVGYNAKKEDIIYSDSWGAGHELKHMSAADAWTMTTGAMTIEPL